MLARMDAFQADIAAVEDHIDDQIAPFAVGGGPAG